MTPSTPENAARVTPPTPRNAAETLRERAAVLAKDARRAFVMGKREWHAFHFAAAELRRCADELEAEVAS